MKAIQTRTYLGLLGIIILIVVINTFSGQVFRGATLDLTEEKLYSLSEGSKNIVKDIKDRLTIKYYFSATDGAEIPSFHAYGERVKDLLKSYADLSENLKMEVFDPRPDSEEAEWAEKYGIAGIQVMSGDVLYCGMVIINGMGDEETIPFFDSKREEFLEYDISKILSSLSDSQKTVAAIYTPISIEGMPSMPGMPQNQQDNSMWYFLEDLKQMYDLRIIHTLETIDDDINLLILLHPKKLDKGSQYSFDQYVLKGGNALVLVDPFCESDIPKSGQNMMMAMPDERSSELPSILTANGIRMDSSKVILDRERAAQVQTAPGQVTDYYAWLSLGINDVDKKDSVTGKLESMLFPSPGALSYEPKDSLKVLPLITTSESASLNDKNILTFGGPPDRLTKTFKPGSVKMNVALKAYGSFVSSFSEVPASEENPEEKISKNEHINKSQKEASVIVIADTDFLANRFSLNVANLFGNIILTPMNDNQNLFFNSLENLTGSISLTDVRSRGRFSRPFTRVADIEAKAQLRWQQEEISLVNQVEESNRRISELMQQGGEGSADNKILAEIKSFRNRKKEVQKKLREVRKNLRMEKEFLGTQLFLINTFLIPFLIMLYGIYHLLSANTKNPE